MNKKNICLEVIAQLSEILTQLNESTYAQKLLILNGSSVGQHVRHVVEFYLCLLKGLDAGVVNYDSRERNYLLETDLNYTQNTLNLIIEELESIINYNRNLQIVVNFNENEPFLVESTFMREIVYMIEHSIHHYALIRIGLQENFKQVQIPANFGIAYSTIKHQEAA